MSEDLLNTLVEQLNLASKGLSEMHKAVLKLLSELTPDEMQVWNNIDERAKQHRKQMVPAYDDINTIRTTDPIIYFERLKALLERDTDQIKSLANDIMELVRNHKSS